jgi:hypothetical protein
MHGQRGLSEVSFKMRAQPRDDVICNYVADARDCIICTWPSLTENIPFSNSMYDNYCKSCICYFGKDFKSFIQKLIFP